MQILILSDMNRTVVPNNIAIKKKVTLIKRRNMIDMYISWWTSNMQVHHIID